MRWKPIKCSLAFEKSILTRHLQGSNLCQFVWQSWQCVWQIWQYVWQIWQSEFPSPKCWWSALYELDLFCILTTNFNKLAISIIITTCSVHSHANMGVSFYNVNISFPILHHHWRHSSQTCTQHHRQPSHYMYEVMNSTHQRLYEQVHRVHRTVSLKMVILLFHIFTCAL